MRLESAGLSIFCFVGLAGYDSGPVNRQRWFESSTKLSPRWSSGYDFGLPNRRREFDSHTRLIDSCPISQDGKALVLQTSHAGVRLLHRAPSFGRVAQLAEHPIRNRAVEGSTPYVTSAFSIFHLSSFILFHLSLT
jgi:hypothetical protein